VHRPPAAGRRGRVTARPVAGILTGSIPPPRKPEEFTREHRPSWPVRDAEVRRRLRRHFPQAEEAGRATGRETAQSLGEEETREEEVRSGEYGEKIVVSPRSPAAHTSLASSCTAGPRRVCRRRNSSA